MEDIVDISFRRDILLFCIISDEDSLAELLSIVEENASTIATLQMMHDNARKVLMIEGSCDGDLRYGDDAQSVVIDSIMEHSIADAPLLQRIDRRIRMRHRQSHITRRKIL
jgi:hypothetical protein